MSAKSPTMIVSISAAEYPGLVILAFDHPDDIMMQSKTDQSSYLTTSSRLNTSESNNTDQR